MRILIHGINFSPELTGIGKYSGEMAEWLVSQGHEVRVVTAPPYYPQWRVAEGFSGWWYRKDASWYCPTLPIPLPRGERERSGLMVYRCPLWVPATPSGLKRMLHLASFALSSFPVMLLQILWRPDVVLVVEPPLFCAPQAWLVARLSGGKAWFHVQDFEVDAAFELGILKSSSLRRMVLVLERWLMRRFDVVSTISGKMLERVITKGVNAPRACLFPNWVDLNLIQPRSGQNDLRSEWGIGAGQIVALYSGNMGEKQGLEILLEVAAKLVVRSEILFILCGEGAAKTRLLEQFPSLPNVQWRPLQPLQRLNDLLNLADIHLLPQRADAADLVMPSKLTGMLASGRPVIATALPGTQVAKVVERCGVVVMPGNVEALADAVLSLAGDAATRVELGAMARAYAESNLGRDAILSRFEGELRSLTEN